MVEIMAPAGSFESLQAAINAGAGSVYFGVGKLNMRSRSANFTFDDLEEIVSICKETHVKSYLTMNIVVYNNEISQIHDILDRAKTAGVTAVIASDLAVITYARKIGVEVHLSTQCNVSNIESVKFYSQFADVVVLARETKLDDITYICDQIKEQNIKGPNGELVQIEIFIHGALCIAISGKCYMSLHQYNSSANRGACFQACRRSYDVKDTETGDELNVDNQYIMSPSDLCTIEILDKIIASGASILKIEGRGRSPEYVDTVVRTYKEAVELIESDNWSLDKAKEFKKRLENVFNRGFWEGGYYLGTKINEWAHIYGSKTKEQKQTVGKVIHYYSKACVAEILIEAQELLVGDEIYVMGPKTGVLREKITQIVKDETDISVAKQGDAVTIKVSSVVKNNDAVYKIVKT